ncbi:replication initiation protein [Francisella adeliensis]|uniref:replication initiation protein n=1 Tax=Francisella adeliensis TaxID=2007306 RepID=UPI001907F03E|nr:replication initiation protein [Francisella adeliensis]MBK2085929.1 replication initiation protein [Francisella adeliensis]
MIKETLTTQKKVRCSNEKGYSIIRNLAIALEKPYIQANPLNSYEWIILDIDHENTFIDDLPIKPNIIVYNKDNNKAHYYFKILAVHNNGFSSYKAIEYLRAVIYGLNILLGGDIAFNQQLSKNPLAKDHWRVLEVHNREYELSELAEYCELVPRYKIKAIEDIKDRADIIGRNQTIFDTVRAEAYRMDNPTEANIRALAESFNNSLANPLPTNEIKSIAKSIAKYMSKPRNKEQKEKFIEKQKERNKKSQAVRKEKAQVKKDKAFVLFANPKIKLQEIANRLEISLISVKKYKAEYKRYILPNQVVPPITTKGVSKLENETFKVENYLADTFSLYAEREDTEKIPICTIDRLLE